MYIRFELDVAKWMKRGAGVRNGGLHSVKGSFTLYEDRWFSKLVLR